MRPVTLSEGEVAELVHVFGLYPESVPSVVAAVEEIRASPWAERQRRLARQAAKLEREKEEH
jgi:hypothetical protein